MGAVLEPLIVRYFTRISYLHGTYFVDPDAAREKTPFFPDRVQRSREHYPKLDKGASATSGTAETAARSSFVRVLGIPLTPT